MPDINITTIKHEHQRYETVGDWQIGAFENINIKVSNMNNPTYEFLVGIHELIEAMLCKQYGITEEVVDSWDMDHLDSNDPGSIPGCPYYRQHFLATIIERMLADELEVDWDLYEEAIESL